MKYKKNQQKVQNFKTQCHILANLTVKQHGMMLPEHQNVTWMPSFPTCLIMNCFTGRINRESELHTQAFITYASIQNPVIFAKTCQKMLFVCNSFWQIDKWRQINVVIVVLDTHWSDPDRISVRIAGLGIRGLCCPLAFHEHYLRESKWKHKNILPDLLHYTYFYSITVQ